MASSGCPFRPAGEMRLEPWQAAPRLWPPPPMRTTSEGRPPHIPGMKALPIRGRSLRGASERGIRR